MSKLSGVLVMGILSTYVYDFVQENVLSHLMSFDGVNPHSVVVLDNCAIQHTAEVKSMLEEIGVLVHFLPVYSLDFNPIEEAFSKVKISITKIQFHTIFTYQLQHVVS